jgi:hypothetical protein
MLRKGFSYYSKSILTHFWKTCNIQWVRIFILSIVLFFNANHYRYSQHDMIVFQQIGNYQVSKIILELSQKYKIDPLLITSIILSESSGYPFAVSYMNARGLMQLMPGTALLVARTMHPKDYQYLKDNPGFIYDPRLNIELACLHLKDMYHYMAKKWEPALHIYNLSVNSFRKGARNHPYVNGIITRYQKWKS